MAIDNNHYVSLTGLEEFLKKLTDAYKNNTSASTKFIVNYAKEAGKATLDGSGNNIVQTYLPIDTAASTYVPLTRVIGTKPATDPVWGTGYVDLSKDISASDLRGVLNVADGAQVNVLEKVKFKGNGDSQASALTIDTSDKSVTIDISDYALKSEVAKVMDYKGSKTALELKGIATGTITEAMNGDVYTCSTESSESGATAYKAGFEYVAVVSGTAPNLTLTFEELGKNFAGLASEDWCKGAFLSTTEFTGAVAGVKVNAAVAADSAAKLTTGRDVTLTGDVTGSVSAWDGSNNLSIATSIAAGSIVNADVNANAAIAQTKIAGSAANTTLADDIAAKANKLAAGYVSGATPDSYIATFDANGDLASAGVLVSKLKNGGVTNGNTSFVTGGDVFTAINNLGNVVNDVKVKIGSGTATSIVTSGIATINIDAAPTNGSNNLVTSDGVYDAIDDLKNVYSKVVGSNGTTHIQTLQEASNTEIDGLFA